MTLYLYLNWVLAKLLSKKQDALKMNTIPHNLHLHYLIANF